MRIRDVVDAIENESLPKIRNLGKTSLSEIKTKLLDFGYSHLTINEKKAFFLDMLEMNGYIN
jgi:DNA-directed RNA polymerase alpha subunit